MPPAVRSSTSPSSKTCLKRSLTDGAPAQRRFMRVNIWLRRRVAGEWLRRPRRRKCSAAPRRKLKTRTAWFAFLWRRGVASTLSADQADAGAVRFAVADAPLDGAAFGDGASSDV